MTDNRRNIQMVLGKLETEYEALLEKTVPLELFINEYIHTCSDGQERIYLENEQRNMSAHHTKLLKMQLEAMKKYQNILKSRIDDLENLIKESK